MSNYTQNVSYGQKDALTQGDPNKVILGSQIDAEFSEISTAIASKEDFANKGQPSGYAPLDSSSLLTDAYLTTNIPRLNGTMTITGRWTFSTLGPIFSVASAAAANGWSLNINNANPGIQFYETDAPADEKCWELHVTGGDFILAGWNDAFGTQFGAVTVQRVGNTVGTWTFNGTGYVFNTGAVQVTSIELGNAADTTLARVSAGVLSVEGATLATVSQAQTISAAWNFTTAPQVASLELGHATDTTLTRVSAGVVAIEGANVVTETSGDARYKKQGRNTIPIMAAAMIPAATNGPAQATVTAATNLQTYKTLDFDQTTQEFAHFQIPFPKGWNEGTITFQPIWTAAAGTGGVVWELEAVAVGNDDAIDVAWGTAQNSIDTLIATGDIHVGPESSAITIAGTPAADDLVFFRIKRAPANASDTLTGDARLIGIRIFYTDNAADDT